MSTSFGRIGFERVVLLALMGAMQLALHTPVVAMGAPPHAGVTTIKPPPALPSEKCPSRTGNRRGGPTTRACARK
jgi:hypothetical protein